MLEYLSLAQSTRLELSVAGFSLNRPHSMEVLGAILTRYHLRCAEPKRRNPCVKAIRSYLEPRLTERPFFYQSEEVEFFYARQEGEYYYDVELRMLQDPQNIMYFYYPGDEGFLEEEASPDEEQGGVRVTEDWCPDRDVRVFLQQGFYSKVRVQTDSRPDWSDMLTIYHELHGLIEAQIIFWCSLEEKDKWIDEDLEIHRRSE